MKKIFCFQIIFFLFFASQVFSQTKIQPATDVLAEQEFRRGVQAFYRGYFNEAIIEFEKVLSYTPDNIFVLDWLGRAYYHSGMESNALHQWEYAAENGYGGLLLKNRIEIVKDRRVPAIYFNNKERYVEAADFPGSKDKTLFFSQPVSAFAANDGTIWVLAYGSNEIIQIDVNGRIVTRYAGPLTGFDRPVDIARLRSGKFVISENASDRISILNENCLFEKSIGTKGTGNGQFLGPQYIALDDTDRIFVTDFGNCRVNVFDKDGKYLFNFGKKTAHFEGLKSPTGIAFLNGNIYVADSITGNIFIFDTAGNFSGELLQNKSLQNPEALRIWNDCILVADTNKVLAVNYSTGEISQIANIGNAPARLTCATGDINGNIIVTDIEANEVYVLAKISELTGGLFVQIERVVSDSFPNILIDVRVENRKRQAVVGLKEVNFLLTEKGLVMPEQKFEGYAFLEDRCNIVIIIDRNISNKKNAQSIETAVREIAADMNSNDFLSIVTAGAIPVMEMQDKPENYKNFTVKMLENDYSKNPAIDLAVRLAGNNLVMQQTKRAIIYVTNGEVAKNGFEKYTYTDIVSWLNNNDISFSTVYSAYGKNNEQINYLTNHSNGLEYYIYRPEGIKGIVGEIKNLPSGIYRLSAKSNMLTDFGTKYLPLEVEVYLHNRSGRDELGYFAPLQ